MLGWFTFTGRWSDVFFHQLCHVVIQYNCVESPTFVSSCDLLTHGCQETLRVEESGHPEHARPSLEQPACELTVPIKKIRKPEPDCSWLPRDLPTSKTDINHTAFYNFNCFKSHTGIGTVSWSNNQRRIQDFINESKVYPITFFSFPSLPTLSPSFPYFVFFHFRICLFRGSEAEPPIDVALSPENMWNIMRFGGFYALWRQTCGSLVPT